MDDPTDTHQKDIEDIKDAIRNNNTAAAEAKIREYLKKQQEIKLNIGVTGQSGSGKSTFINSFREIDDDDDENAAKTGCVETTRVVKAYPHPKYPNVVLWDLPGAGTPTFPADKYLELVGFEKFDFFIIISDTRFRENDVKLAQEIKKMGKKFYFIRSKIDNDMRAEERRQKKNFDTEKTLTLIRNNCIEGLQKQGFESPQVFLLSSFDLHLYDFPLLHKTLEKELPSHKRRALLFAMPSINQELINKKMEAFKAFIWLHATLCAGAAAVPVPELSVSVDVNVMLVEVQCYVTGFGLDIPSLKKLADSMKVSFEDLKAVIRSPLAATEITRDLVLNEFMKLGDVAAESTAAEVLKYIPIVGTIAAMGIAFKMVFCALNHFVETLAEDARNVFKRALNI